MRFATAIACSGPSTSTQRPFAASVDSISARRGASAASAATAALIASAAALRPRDEPRQPFRSVLGLDDDVDGGEVGLRPCRRRRRRPPTVRRTRTAHRRGLRRPPGAWPCATYRLPGPDDDVDRRHRLGAVRHRADRLRAADAVDDVDAGDRRGREHDVGHAPVAVRTGRTPRPRPRPPPSPVPPSSAPSTGTRHGRRARSSRRARPAGATSAHGGRLGRR